MILYRERLIHAQAEMKTLNNAVYELTRANLRYQDYAQEERERSMEQERQRLTRDIHDIAGYALTNAMMMAESGKIMMQNEPEKLPGHFDEIRETMSSCMEEIRLTLRDYRSTHFAGPTGFTAIARMARIFSTATQIHVRAEYGNVEWNFSDGIGEIIYHFVQEGLINSFRHGKPTAIRILFNEDAEWIKVNILDNGRGVQSLQEGIGISGMRQRANGVGGRVEIETAVDGFSISLLLPTIERLRDA
jgi:signal transduction histidine kinase